MTPCLSRHEVMAFLVNTCANYVVVYVSFSAGNIGKPGTGSSRSLIAPKLVLEDCNLGYLGKRVYSTSRHIQYPHTSRYTFPTG